ncbi:SRPBCC family protein [Accumulibacter sp.]|uniref:SRPBCC family protein n=1 Tax=Accumulibacter sp. TaxID=2053492 RepID=UPI0028C47138|nr:SRPBCC family protein [Accumulibacter sp.]
MQAELFIPASQKKVWEVLTDFDNLARFLSNVVTSKVLSRQGNSIRVSQTGTTSFGPLTMHFQSEREITLMPITGFESRMISGDMKQYHGITRLEASGNGTRIIYQAEAVPDTVLPPSLGIALIQSETREHYQEIRNEVLRRK